MALFDSTDRRFAKTLSELVNCNPFLPKWVELERKALGPQFSDAPRAYGWQAQWGPGHLLPLGLPSVHPNIQAMGERVDQLAGQTRQRLVENVPASAEELLLYEDLAMYKLYRQEALAGDLDQLVLVGASTEQTPSNNQEQLIQRAWRRFRTSFVEFFAGIRQPFPSRRKSAHVFAWFYQLRRAFYYIFHNIVGQSQPTIRLRAEVWQSIYTHDMRRWERTLFDRQGNLHDPMARIPTLITGPSGTGKELAATAIGRSRYIPFNEKTVCFAADFTGAAHSLNLSALAPTLIESELFGHAKGAFTGAVKDRIGWLAQCGDYGTVFLDEVGDLDPAIQVKLLRVLQTGDFQRLGETEIKHFQGKIIAATNRDLADQMRRGRFREDFYYRLCADQIETPSLRQQLNEAPEDLHDLLLFIAEKMIGEDEAELLAREAQDWIDRELPHDYPWPGNFRELEQCVRNIMIRGSYRPTHSGRWAAPSDPRQALAAAVIEGTLTLEELQKRYFTLVYAQTDDYKEAARRLKCDWRTLRGRIDQELLRQLKQA